MKTIYFLIIFFFSFSSLAFAQTNRFYYQVSFKEDSLASNYITETVILDINKDKIKFYSEDFLIKDSLRNETGNYLYSYNKFRHKLIRNKNSNITLNYVSLSPNYYVYETKDHQNWKILKDTKEIDGIKLQKATTNYGGRIWEAWFAPSIPLQEGPYKFKGLPGLIVELKDLKEQYIFMLFKSKNLNYNYNTDYFLENLNASKPIKISEEAYKKLLLDNFINPLKDFGEGGLIVENENGEKVKANSRDVIAGQQNYLRKHNNPIELDKAIKYPTK